MRGPAALLAFSLLLAPVAACGNDRGRDDPDAAPTATSAGRSVMVDTDLASDDLVALAFLLSSTEVDVRAITVSGTGEVRCPRGVEVAMGLLSITGDDEVPVACGRRTPLAGEHAFPADWRDAADDAWGLALPDVEAPTSTPSAVDLLARTLAPGETTLLTLGPLTNVAEAFRAHPDLAGQVRSIVVMGGAVDVGGNVHLEAGDSPTAEWNLYVDPTAADEVLGSGAPVVLVGLDASSRAPVDQAFLDLLAGNTHTTAAGLVATLLAGNPQVASGEAYFWDPLAAAAVLDEGLLTTEVARIDVVTEEGVDSGRTRRDADGSRVTVAVDADADAFERLLVRTLDGLGPDDELVLPSEP
jgi:inosine-uridine nucleoside N-ribohydrolase